MGFRLSRIKGAALIAGVAAAFALIGIAVAPHSSSGEQAPGQDGTCVDFAREVDPMTVAVDTGYDPEKDVVYAHVAGRTYVLRGTDPACATLATARAVRAHALDAHRANVEATCAAVRKDVAAGRAEVHGRAFDRRAAQRFLATDCPS